MASAAIAPSSASTRTERYLEAEGSLWRHYGLEPHERFIDLDAPAARLRVLEVGSGEPVLFVHGTVGPGGWPSLIRELPGFRSDRPRAARLGAELSDRVLGAELRRRSSREVLRGALDALELEWAHIVGGSIGNVWALRLASAAPLPGPPGRPAGRRADRVRSPRSRNHQAHRLTRGRTDGPHARQPFPAALDPAPVGALDRASTTGASQTSSSTGA